MKSYLFPIKSVETSNLKQDQAEKKKKKKDIESGKLLTRNSILWRASMTNFYLYSFSPYLIFHLLYY